MTFAFAAKTTQTELVAMVADAEHRGGLVLSDPAGARRLSFQRFGRLGPDFCAIYRDSDHGAYLVVTSATWGKDLCLMGQVTSADMVTLTERDGVFYRMDGVVILPVADPATRLIGAGSGL